MSATTSAATGRCFGIQRVCQVWERSRSALYARRARAHHRLGAGPARRGPPPRQSDAQLLAAIRTDLARSPFHGEGHRKVHARLRILDGIRVARTRVLRVMRAHGLLSPHRGRQGAAKTHDGRVITQAPNVMWGTDGVRVFTLDDGWGWIFAAVEHWNAECVGWHVCKVGSRFAALDPIAQGLERLYGSLDADVARGLALRMDHGSQVRATTAGPVRPSAGAAAWAALARDQSGWGQGGVRSGHGADHRPAEQTRLFERHELASGRGLMTGGMLTPSIAHEGEAPPKASCKSEPTHVGPDGVPSDGRMPPNTVLRLS